LATQMFPGVAGSRLHPPLPAGRHGHAQHAHGSGAGAGAGLLTCASVKGSGPPSTARGRWPSEPS